MVICRHKITMLNIRYKSLYDTLDRKKNLLDHLDHFAVRLNQFAVRVVMRRYENLGKLMLQTRIGVLSPHVALRPIKILYLIRAPLDIPPFV